MMYGEYFTSTDAKGAHYLEIKAFLESPVEFDTKVSHFVGFSIESNFRNEWFWTGVDAKKSDWSMFIHKAGDRSFGYVEKLV